MGQLRVNMWFMLRDHLFNGASLGVHVGNGGTNGPTKSRSTTGPQRVGNESVHVCRGRRGVSAKVNQGPTKFHHGLKVSAHSFVTKLGLAAFPSQSQHQCYNP